MKNDLATSILIAVVGIAIAYFACDSLLPKNNTFEIKTVDSSAIGADITEPSPEVFNNKAINPNTEVIIVGDCDDYNENGECLDENGEIIREGNIDKENQ